MSMMDGEAGAGSTRVGSTQDDVSSLPAQPTIADNDRLERVAVVLGVPCSRLTELLSSEWRRRDIRSDDEHYVSGMNRYLPDRFEELPGPQQAELIERLSRSHYKQDTEFSRRASAMARDHYLLKRK